MRDVANRSLQEVLSGSIKDLSRDLKVLAEASQALEILKDLPKSDTICKPLKKV